MRGPGFESRHLQLPLPQSMSSNVYSGGEAMPAVDLVPLKVHGRMHFKDNDSHELLGGASNKDCLV